MKPARIEVHIEELILRGFERGDRQVIAEAVQRELADLFESRGLSPAILQSVEIARLDGGAFRVTTGKTAGVGRQIAKAIYGGLHNG